MSASVTNHLISAEVQSFITDRRSRHLAVGTLEFYSQELRYFTAWIEASHTLYVEELTPDMIRLWFLALEQRGRNPGGVHASWRCVKAFLLWWEREAEPENWKNPIRKVAAPKISTDPLPGVSVDDFKKLVATCKDGRDFFDLRDRAIFLTLFDCGVRRNELISINIGDVNLQTGQIWIHKGKGNKRRAVYIGAKSRRAITRYLRKRGQVKPIDPLWVIHAGTRMSEDGLRQMVVNRSKKAGLAKVPGLHDFRRAFALECLRSGMDVFTLQRLMGHSSLAILRRYLAQNEDDLGEEHDAHGPVDGMDLD